MPELTADEIKNQIYEQASSLPEDDVNADTFEEHGLGQGIDVSEEEEEELQPEEVEVEMPLDRKHQYAKEQALRKERVAWENLTSEEQLRFYQARGSVPPKVENGYPSFNQSEQMAMNALEADFLELRDRYGHDLVNKFGDDFRIGKVRIPAGIERTDNAHEALFLSWMVGNKIFDKMNYKEQREFLRATEGPPLRSRSRDITNPEHKRPTPKPRKPRQRQEATYRFPEITPDDLSEMLRDWSKKHPEKFK